MRKHPRVMISAGARKKPEKLVGDLSGHLRLLPYMGILIAIRWNVMLFLITRFFDGVSAGSAQHSRSGCGKTKTFDDIFFIPAP